MREQYPFFRDGDEQTQAIIGEGAVSADLDGDYQKPYAVLTQKRLYCKNEQGNFITDAAALRSAGKGLLPGQNWFLWAVAACVGLTMVLLCLWYWGMGGRWRTENISYDAQMYIDNYQALEEKIPEYEQQIKTYEEALAVRDTAQAEWDGNDYGTMSAHISSISSRVEELPQKIIEYQSVISEEQKEIERIEEWLNVTAPVMIEVARAKMAGDPTIMNVSSKHFNAWNMVNENTIETVTSGQKTNSNKLAVLKKELGENERMLTKLQEQLAAAKEEMAGMEDQAEAIQQLQARIDTQQSIMDGIPYENIKQSIERYETGKADYNNAQDVQRKVKLFLPCLLAFAACVVAFIILTALKRAKSAVVMALVSACVGLVCASLSNINLPNIQGFGWGDYYIMPPPLSIALRVLPVLAVVLVALALWWNHKKTVFQIVHNTGAFSFTPSVYPAEELRQFAEQVRLMREGEANGE